MPIQDPPELSWRCPCCWSNNPTRELAEQCASSHDSLPAEKTMSEVKRYSVRGSTAQQGEGGEK